MKLVRLKTHRFHSKLLSEANVKADRIVTNGPITKNGDLPVLEPLKKSYFDVPTTQMFIVAFFVSAGV